MVIGEIQGCRVHSKHCTCNNFIIIYISLTLAFSSLPIQCITLQTRRTSTHHSRSATAMVTATTAVHPLQTSYPDEPQHLPDVVADDLPIISLDARQVAIGWDTRIWSRLCVSVSLVHLSPFCSFFSLDSTIDVSPRIFSSSFDYMYPATTFGYVTTAGAPNVSIPSPSSGCSTRSRSVFPIRHAFGSFPMAPLDPERYYTLACRIKTNRTRSDLSVYSFPSPFNTN